MVALPVPILGEKAETPTPVNHKNKSSRSSPVGLVWWRPRHFISLLDSVGQAGGKAARFCVR
jgi:hypothetical protein